MSNQSSIFEWSAGSATIGTGKTRTGKYNLSDYGGFLERAIRVARSDGFRSVVLLPAGPNDPYQIGAEQVTMDSNESIIIPPGAYVYLSSTVPQFDFGGGILGSYSGFIVQGSNCRLGGGGTIVDNAGRSGANHIMIRGHNFTCFDLTWDIAQPGNDPTNSVHIFNSDGGLVTSPWVNTRIERQQIHPNTSTVCIAAPAMNGLILRDWLVTPKAGETVRSGRAIWSFNQSANIKLQDMLVRNIGSTGGGLLDCVMRDRHGATAFDTNLNMSDIVIQDCAVKNDLAAPLGGIRLFGTIRATINNLLVKNWTTGQTHFLMISSEDGTTAGTAAQDININNVLADNVGLAASSWGFCGIEKAAYVRGTNWTIKNSPYTCITPTVGATGSTRLELDNITMQAGGGFTGTAIAFTTPTSMATQNQWWFTKIKWEGGFTAPWSDPLANGRYRFEHDWDGTNGFSVTALNKTAQAKNNP